MSLSTSAYSGLLFSKITALRFRGRPVRGYLLQEFCDAVGFGVVTEAKALTGIILSPVNRPFSTGTGIFTISATNIADIIESVAEGLWDDLARSEGRRRIQGPLARRFYLAVGETTVEHFALASLTSDANGTATFPAFGGAIGTMAGLIEGFPRWRGRSYWIRFCTAIATGICQETAANGTGTLTGATTPPPGGGVVDID